MDSAGINFGDPIKNYIISAMQSDGITVHSTFSFSIIHNYNTINRRKYWYWEIIVIEEDISLLSEGDTCEAYYFGNNPIYTTDNTNPYNPNTTGFNSDKSINTNLFVSLTGTGTISTKISSGNNLNYISSFSQ